jgi:hypothetical protein
VVASPAAAWVRRERWDALRKDEREKISAVVPRLRRRTAIKI